MGNSAALPLGPVVGNLCSIGHQWRSQVPLGRADRRGALDGWWDRPLVTCLWPQCHTGQHALAYLRVLDHPIARRPELRGALDLRAAPGPTARASSEVAA